MILISGVLMGKDPVSVGGNTSTEPTPEPMKPSAPPIRQRHVLKKEPVCECDAAG